VGGLTKKNKENKKRLEQRKNIPTKKEEIPKVVPTPPKKEKVCKQKEEALKSTTTSPKSYKMVWRPKKVQPSPSTPLGMDIPSSSKK
jgi:hypothetical protein